MVFRRDKKLSHSGSHRLFDYFVVLEMRYFETKKQAPELRDLRC